MRLLISILFVIPLQTFGQSNLKDCRAIVIGIVETDEGEPLIGATVSLDKDQRIFTSDSTGSFQLSGLCGDEVNFKVSYVGFETARVTVKTVNKSKVVVKLTPSVKVLHDLVFEGTHTQQHGLTQSVDILSEEDLAIHRGKSIGEMATQLSGVSTISTGPAIFKPVIQGLHSQRILILNNAVRQEGQQWGVEHAPELDSYIASEIEVVKGAETVRYGADAMGGVLIITTPALHYSKGLGGVLDVNFNSNNRLGAFSGAVEGGTSKGLAWRVQGSVKRGGDFHTPDYNLSNTGVRELNGSVTFGVKRAQRSFEIYFSSFNTELGILRSSHTGNLNDLETSIKSGKPWYIENFTYSIDNPRQQINHQLLKLKSTFLLSSTSTLNLQYAGQYNQRKEFDIRRSSTNNKAALSLDLLTQSLDVSVDRKTSLWNSSVGLSGWFKNNNNIFSTGILPDYRQANGALFLLGKRSWKEWQVEAGGRLEYQYLKVLTFNSADDLLKPTYSFVTSSASIGAARKISKQGRLTSNLSFSARPPHTSELFSIGLHHSAGVIEEGLLITNGQLNDDMKSIDKEQSLKWINSVQFIVAKNVTIDASAYLNWFHNFVYLQPYDTRLTIRGFFPVFRYNQTAAIFQGGELMVNADVTRNIKYRLSAAYVYARNISDDDKLPMIPPGQIEQSLSYTWDHVAKWKNVFVKVSVPFVLQQFNAPRVVYPSDVNDNTITKTFDFMPAPDSYALVNLIVGGELPIGNRVLSATLSVDNLLNTTYRSYMNRLRYFADEPGRNFSLRIAYKFHQHNI